MRKHTWTISALIAVTSGCTGPSAARAPQPPAKDVHPVFSALLSFGGGGYEHDTDGVGLDGDTGGGFFRLLVEGNSHAGFGGGLVIEGFGSEDDLFDDVPGAEPTEGAWGEVSPYFLYRVTGGDNFRMPVRAGVYFQSLGIEGQTSGDEIDWDTVGLRFAVEPEFVLARGDNVEFSLGGEVVLGFGGTEIQATVGNAATADFDASAGTFGLEVGPRLRVSAFAAALSLLHRQIRVDDSDRQNGIVFPGVDASFTGLVLTLGVRF
jgi:hypothetical protein